jgi:hypothetical protein
VIDEVGAFIAGTHDVAFLINSRSRAFSEPHRLCGCGRTSH